MRAMFTSNHTNQDLSSREDNKSKVISLFIIILFITLFGIVSYNETSQENNVLPLSLISMNASEESEEQNQLKPMHGKSSREILYHDFRTLPYSHSSNGTDTRRESNGMSLKFNR